MARLRAATRFGSSGVGSTMQDIGAALARQAETAGERLQSLASAFRESLPTEGAAALVSGGLDTATSYFGDRDMRDIGRDLVDVIRRHPLEALLVGAGIGYVISRLASRGPSMTNGGGMRLRDIMTRHVETVRPDAPLKEAAAKMADLDVGAIPVCDGERMVGMLTDRDVTIRAVARGADASTPVREIMTTTLRWAYEDESVEKAREEMRKKKIRRLPIVDSSKRLVGIVSLGDLAVETETEQAGDVLERVSAARPTH
jgi:CBS domain-containing protein